MSRLVLIVGSPQPLIGHVRESLADITVARTLLGYEPTVSFSDGLQRTIANLQQGG